MIKGVLSEEEVNAANKAIDEHSFNERKEKELRNSNEKTLFAGDEKTGRFDLGGMLGWEEGGEVFRNMLVHPRLVEYLHVLVGEGY